MPQYIDQPANRVRAQEWSAAQTFDNTDEAQVGIVYADALPGTIATYTSNVTFEGTPAEGQHDVYLWRYDGAAGSRDHGILLAHHLETNWLNTHELYITLDRTSETKTATANAGTDRITVVDNDDFFIGEHAMIKFTTTGTLPGNLVADTQYHVRDYTANTFKVALTKGGTPIDITSAGTGTLSVYITFPQVRPEFLTINRSNGLGHKMFRGIEDFYVAARQDGYAPQFRVRTDGTYPIFPCHPTVDNTDATWTMGTTDATKLAVALYAHPSQTANVLLVERPTVGSVYMDNNLGLYLLDASVFALTVRNNATVAGTLDVTGAINGSAFNPNNYAIKYGNIAFQSYDASYAWFGQNTYYNGSGYVRIATGYVGMVQFRQGEVCLYSNTTGSGNVTPTMRLKAGHAGSGSVGLGGSISENTNDYSGATMLVNSTTTYLQVCPTYADNAAAVAGGLAAGGLYKTAAGDLRIRV